MDYTCDILSVSKHQQQTISGKVSVGTNGAKASAIFSKPNVNANYAFINEQPEFLLEMMVIRSKLRIILI